MAGPTTPPAPRKRTRLVIPRACQDCQYFQPGRRPSTEEHDGTCRYGPPSNYSTPLPPDPDDEVGPEPLEYGELATITFSDNTYTGWPVVKGTDWCGSWEGR
jgi:hypothetical protein